MSWEPGSPSQQHCPASRHGDTHHFMPVRVRPYVGTLREGTASYQQVCDLCGRTDGEIRRDELDK